MRIIDMHCDTIYLLQDSDEGIRQNSLQIDLHKMKEAGYLALKELKRLEMKFQFRIVRSTFIMSRNWHGMNHI